MIHWSSPTNTGSYRDWNGIDFGTRVLYQFVKMLKVWWEGDGIDQAGPRYHPVIFVFCPLPGLICEHFYRDVA